MIKCWREDQTPICFRKFLIFSLYPPPPPPHPKYYEKNSSRTYQMCYPFSLALRLRRICTNNETFVLRTNELIDYLYKCGYNRYFLHGKYNELTISQGQKQLRLMTLPHWTNQNVFPSLSPTTQPFVSSRPLFANIFASLFHLPVADRRCSNLSDFLVRAKLRNPTQHNQRRGSYLCGKN